MKSLLVFPFFFFAFGFIQIVFLYQWGLIPGMGKTRR
jgi:hypothetical protein